MQILLIMLIVVLLAFSVLLLALAKQSPREKQTEDKEQEEYIRDYAETVRQTGGSMKKLEHWKVIAIYLIIYDMIAVNFSYFMALLVRFDFRYSSIPTDYFAAWRSFAPIYTIIILAVFGCMHLYNSVWRFASFHELIKITVATVITGVLHIVGITIFWERMPASYYLIGIMLQFFLTVGVRFSNWKPSVYYSFKLLKKMFSYSFWSLCEALANWTIFWVDTFIVGNYFSEYQLGLYKNSTNMVQSIMGMISASMSPVLLSTLSRLKNNPEKYKKAFLNIHSLIIYLVAPMGIGLFLYRKMATLLLFGSKWGEASNIVGAWGLMMMCSVIFYSFPAELYKSKGIPQMLFLSQCIYLLFMIPICVVTAKFGFWIMVYSRCGAIIIQMIIGIVFMKKFFEIDLQDYFKSFLYPLIATIAMILISEVTKWYLKGIIGDFIGILVCVLVYLAVVYVVARKQLLNIIQTIKKEKV